MIRISRLAMFASCLGASLLPPLTAFAASAPAIAPLTGVWPQSYADLPPDPAMRFGTLPNGLRYVVMKNATPGGQASLRLRIDAGSMEETDAQQGLAHFLEHMAFDGSRHVPEGEMIKILQRHGLAFGADTNASTSWENTTYKLDLPKADEDTVNSSLMLLREVASELTLNQDAIDRERGVVLSEERLRDTPGYEVLKQDFAFTLKGLRAPDRFPIGQVEVIQHATHQLIADFYGKYYRPDRAVLVAVGDFDPDAMEAKIKARFGDWAPSAPAGAEPDLGRPQSRGAQTQVIVQPGGPQMVQIEWLNPADRSIDSVAKRRRATLESLGFGILNRRLDRLVRSDDPPFIGAGAYRQDEFHSARVTTIQANIKPGEWRKALDAEVTAVRQLLQYGVSADELAQQIDSSRASLKSAVEGAATRTTPSIADDILSTLDTPEVETSPAEDLSLFEAAVKGLTPAEIDAVMRDAFQGSGPLVSVSMPEAINGGDGAVSQALTQAQAAPVAAPSAEAALHWPYDNFGPLGQVAERKDITDLDTVFVRFENGVRLTIKPTKFSDNQILIQARIGHGLMALPTDRPTPVWAASTAYPEAGLDQLSAQDLDQVLRSRILGKSFTVTDDAFVLSGATRPDDLETQLELLAAYTVHPGWRPEAFLRMKNAAPTFLDQLAATPEGVVNRDLSRMLHSGDRRWGVPSREEIAAEQPADMKAVLAPELAKGPIEIVIVGDTTVEKAIDAVAATFGAQPTRPAADAPPPLSPKALFPAGTPTPLVLTHSGRFDQAIGFVAWPIEDFLSDTQRARNLSVLGEVLQLRLTDQLRKTESVTYSPSAFAAPSQAFAGYGYMSARVEIPPVKLGGFFTDVAVIAADLRGHDISPDELERAKKPAVDDLERRRQTNEYWLNALANAQADPRRLAAIRSSIAQLQHVSAADVRRAAEAYLIDSKAYKVVVKPNGAP
ncbi:MAG TPA: insulinase family protein [Caulobacteraceae bacterium]|nr:insulinase family protein [Caulobacteraceae bacterium]